MVIAHDHSLRAVRTAVNVLAYAHFFAALPDQLREIANVLNSVWLNFILILRVLFVPVLNNFFRCNFKIKFSKLVLTGLVNLPML